MSNDSILDGARVVVDLINPTDLTADERMELATRQKGRFALGNPNAEAFARFVLPGDVEPVLQAIAAAKYEAAEPLFDLRAAHGQSDVAKHAAGLKSRLATTMNEAATAKREAENRLLDADKLTRDGGDPEVMEQMARQDRTDYEILTRRAEVLKAAIVPAENASDDALNAATEQRRKELFAAADERVEQLSRELAAAAGPLFTELLLATAARNLLKVPFAVIEQELKHYAARQAQKERDHQPIPRRAPHPTLVGTAAERNPKVAPPNYGPEGGSFSDLWRRLIGR